MIVKLVIAVCLFACFGANGQSVMIAFNEENLAGGGDVGVDGVDVVKTALLIHQMAYGIQCYILL